MRLISNCLLQTIQCDTICHDDSIKAKFITKNFCQ